MLINSISQSNCVIPPVSQKKSVSSPAIFTGYPTERAQQTEKKSHKFLWGALFLGAAGVATAMIIKKTSATNELNKFKKEFKGLYDQTWDDIVKHFDSKNLKIEKPELKIIKDEKSTELARYIKANNSIEINSHLVNKYKPYEYAIFNVEKDMVFARGNFPLHTLEEIEKLKKDGLIDSSWTIQKLNPKEKELYTKFMLAHEQRHCLQLHTVLNDSNYGSKFLLEDEAKHLKTKNPKLNDLEAMEHAKKNSPYLANFKPINNKSNLMLSCPVKYDEKQIFFTTKNFAKNITEYTSKDAQKYDMNSLEIDANIFASLYLRSKENIAGCDEKIAQIITKMSEIEAFDNLEKFMKINVGNNK